MKTLTALSFALIAISSTAHAAVTCKDLASSKAKIEVLREAKFLNEKNWKNFNVIANMSRRDCKDAVSQELIRVKGELFWKLSSNDDSCDGGNSYGTIYSYDLKTPIAQVADSEIVCGDAAPENKASNHVCDLQAEALAQQKMKDFGLEVTNLASTIEIRDPYIYSVITVTGNVTNKNNRDVSMSVMVDRSKGCNFSSVGISSLAL